MQQQHQFILTFETAARRALDRHLQYTAKAHTRSTAPCTARWLQSSNVRPVCERFQKQKYISKQYSSKQTHATTQTSIASLLNKQQQSNKHRSQALTYEKLVRVRGNESMSDAGGVGDDAGGLAQLVGARRRVGG